MNKAFIPLTISLLLACHARGQITLTHRTEQGVTVSKSYSAKEFPQELLRDLFINSEFIWLSARHDEAVSPSAGKLLGRGINEAAIRFQGDRLAEVRLSVYSRTIMGRWREEPFNREVAFWTRTVQGWANTKGRELSELDVNDHIIVRKLWRNGALEYRLEYGYSEVGLWGELPEFLNVTIRRADVTVSGVAANPAARVRRNQTGDVWLDVPMEWQRNHGMCSPAALARVLRYYGLAMDRHELAAVLETGNSKNGGTKMDLQDAALRKLAKQLGWRLTVAQSWQSADFHRSFAAYNKLAAQTGKPSLKVPLLFLELDALEFYRKMDRETFRRSRLSQKEELAAFRAAIPRYINTGAPLVWEVIHGMFAEPLSDGKNGIYGHTRLIVGYNARKGQILYTDSWGAGHELKLMSEEQAFAMSIGVFCLEPQPAR